MWTLSFGGGTILPTTVGLKEMMHVLCLAHMENGFIIIILQGIRARP